MQMRNEPIAGECIGRECTNQVARDSAEMQDSAEILSDELIIQRVREGEVDLFELILRRYNQRLFRIARSILCDDDEAADVVQETYVSAYEHLVDFEGRSKFSTWLAKIAAYDACARRRKSLRRKLYGSETLDLQPMNSHSPFHNPQASASNNELGQVLTEVVDQLPDELRSVFTLRVVEGLDTLETAECLNLSTANVKTRLHRARLELRTRIDAKIGVDIRKLYQFDGQRCDRIVDRVMKRLHQLSNDTGPS